MWAAQHGEPEVGFYIGDSDGQEETAFREVFGDMPRTYVDPLGRPALSSDPTPFIPPSATAVGGYLVKYIQPGPGILANVHSTDDLLQVMADEKWTYFDADSL